MNNVNASKHLVLASAAVVLAAAIGAVWLVDGKKASPTGGGATTESAAVSAGAKVTPTEPKLRVEPK
jgi:hypothetical protein